MSTANLRSGPGTAVVRAPSSLLEDGLLTHLDPATIDVALAGRQWDAYVAALSDAGWRVVPAPPADHCPDSVFIEDPVVVFDRLAVITRPGAPEREAETEGLASLFADLCLDVATMRGPGTLDGGDVLRLGDVLFVGCSARSNAEGRRQLADAVAPLGLRVQEVSLRDALHLKTAVTAVSDDTVVLQPLWVDPELFRGYRVIPVDESEPFAANTLRIGDRLIVPEAHPRTAALCAPFVDRILEVPADELARAEGGVTCCSILIETDT